MAYKVTGFDIIDNNRSIINASVAGIGTTIATTGSTKLFVVGDSFTTGIATFNVAQGTAPISVSSSTRVDNLNVQYFDNNDSAFYRNASNLNAGAVPAAQVTQSNGLNITGNLNVSGNVSVAGTTFAIGIQQLTIQDRDIVLGLVTSIGSGIETSTDATATHGGISIASTTGSPLFDMPLQVGVNSLPTTYKQFMWISNATGGSYSGVATDAWISNYALGIGTLTVRNGSRLTVGAGFTVFDTYLDAQDIRARNINVSGVTTSGNINVLTGGSYQINGVSVLNSTTLGSNVVNSSLTSVGTLNNLNVSSSGITTVGFITASNVNVSGTTTSTQYNIGVTTVLSTLNSQITLAGIQTIDATTKAALERELAFAPNSFDDIQVSGISTFVNGPVLIGTATSTGTASQVLQVGSAGATRGAYFSGSVGIGTTTPSQPLDVNGNVRFRSGIYDSNNQVGAANSVLTANGSGGWTWQSISAAGGNSITINNDTTTATPLNILFTSASSGSVSAQSVSSSRLTFVPSTGSLGIGTTSPTQELDVLGDVRLRGAIFDNSNLSGSANQVLTAGPSGAGVTWATLTASSVGAISGINVSDDNTGIRYPLFAAAANATTTIQYIDTDGIVYNTSTNCLGIGSLTPTSRLDIIGDVRVAGIITATDFNSSSDRTLKHDIQVIENPIEKVLQLNGVTFSWNETGKPSVGVIAQEVEQVLPELVSDTEPKSVNYNGLIGLLIECVKEQQKQIDELKKVTAKKPRKPKNT